MPFLTSHSQDSPRLMWLSIWIIENGERKTTCISHSLPDFFAAMIHGWNINDGYRGFSTRRKTEQLYSA